MFKEKEEVPAMSIAALEKKYHCVIEVDDKHPQIVATARRHRQALLFDFLCEVDIFLKLQLNRPNI